MGYRRGQHDRARHWVFVAALLSTVTLQARAEDTLGTPAPPAPSGEAAPDTAPPTSAGDSSSAAPELSTAPIDDPKDPEEESAPVVETDPVPPVSQPDESISEPPAAVTVAERRRRYPQYQLNRPQFAFEVTGSLKALVGNPVKRRPDATEVADGVGAGELLDARVRAVSFQFEYQPAFLQRFGVLSFGPSVTIYPVSGTAISGTGDIASTFTSIFSFGGQIRYQARFFREQILVPVIGYSVESIRYKLFNDTINGTVVGKGPLFGAWLLLNGLEPSAASQAYANAGFSRSYLVAELKNIEGTDGTFGFSGQNFFFGLRIEF